MDFNSKYQKIKDIIIDDLNIIESDISKLFIEKTPLNKELSNFLTAPAKRLRPVLGLLFLKNILGDISAQQREILLVIELIHNATLIHDDVIDQSTKRRNKEALNVTFDNNLAVIAGDFLLSIAMEKIINLNSVEVIKICTQALKSTCIGEINQYFNKHKIISIEDYIQKSKEKTALLFQVGIICALHLSYLKDSETTLKIATAFSENFGIAFQIRDDLINVLNSDSLKINDISSGIYNAPVIFAYQEDNTILNTADIKTAIEKTNSIEKTKILMDNYFEKALSAISSLEDNKYKSAIIQLISILKSHL